MFDFLFSKREEADHLVVSIDGDNSMNPSVRSQAVPDLFRQPRLPYRPFAHREPNNPESDPKPLILSEQLQTPHRLFVDKQVINNTYHTGIRLVERNQMPRSALDLLKAEAGQKGRGSGNLRLFEDVRVAAVFSQNRMVLFRLGNVKNANERSVETESIIRDVFLCQKTNGSLLFLVSLEDKALFYILTHEFELLNPQSSFAGFQPRAGVYSEVLNKLICVDGQNDVRLVDFNQEHRRGSNIRVQKKSLIRKGLKRVKELSSYIPFTKRTYKVEFSIKAIGDRVLILKTKRSILDASLHNQRLSLYQISESSSLNFVARLKTDQVWKINQRLLEGYFELLSEKAEVTDFTCNEHSDAITLLTDKGVEVEISPSTQYIKSMTDYKINCEGFVSTYATAFTRYLSESSILIESDAFKYLLVKNGANAMLMQTADRSCLFYNEDLCTNGVRLIPWGASRGLLETNSEIIAVADSYYEVYSVTRGVDLLANLLFFESKFQNQLSSSFYQDFFRGLDSYTLTQFYDSLYTMLLTDFVAQFRLDYDYLDYLSEQYGAEVPEVDKQNSQKHREELLRAIYKSFIMFYDWVDADIGQQVNLQPDLRQDRMFKTIAPVKPSRTSTPSYVAFHSIMDKYITSLDGRPLFQADSGALRANAYLRFAMPRRADELQNVNTAVKSNLMYLAEAGDFINFESIYGHVRPEIKKNFYSVNKSFIDKNLLSLTKRATNLSGFLSGLYSCYRQVDAGLLSNFAGRGFVDVLTTHRLDSVIRTIIVTYNPVLRSTNTSYFDYYLSIKEVDALDVLNELSTYRSDKLAEKTPAVALRPLDTLLVDKGQNVEFSTLLNYIEEFWKTGKFNLFCKIALARLANNLDYIAKAERGKATEVSHLSIDNEDIRAFINDALFVLLSLKRSPNDDRYKSRPLEMLKGFYKKVRQMVDPEEKAGPEPFTLESELVKLAPATVNSLLNFLIEESLRVQDMELRTSILKMLLEFRSTSLIGAEPSSDIRKSISDVLAATELSESWINAANINFLLKHLVDKSDYEGAIQMIISAANVRSKAMKMQRLSSKDFANLMNDSIENITNVHKSLKATEGLRISELNSYLIDAKGYASKFVIKDDKQMKLVESLKDLTRDVKISMVVVKDLEERLATLDTILHLNNVKPNANTIQKLKALLELVTEYMNLGPEYDNADVNTRVIKAFNLYRAQLKIAEQVLIDTPTAFETLKNYLFFCGKFNTARDVSRLDLYVNYNSEPLLRQQDKGVETLYEIFNDVPISAVLEELSNKGVLYPDNISSVIQLQVAQSLKTESRTNKLVIIDLIERLNVNNEYFLYGLTGESKYQWTKTKASQLWHLYAFLKPEFNDHIIFHEILDVYRAVFENTVSQPKLTLIDKHQLYKLLDTFFIVLEKVLLVRTKLMAKSSLNEAEKAFLREFDTRKQFYKDFMIEAQSKLPTRFEFHELYYRAFNVISRSKLLMDALDGLY